MRLPLHQFAILEQGVPEVGAEFGVLRFELLEEVGDVGALGCSFVGALFHEGLVLGDYCPLLEQGFFDHAEGSDDGEGHLLHLQVAGHGGETSGIGKVHEGGVEDVVLMMAEGDFVAAQFLCYFEERFAAVPRTEEAGCAALVAVGLEGHESLVKGDAVAFALLAQIGGVALVIYACHPYVEGMKGECSVAVAQ